MNGAAARSSRLVLVSRSWSRALAGGVLVAALAALVRELSGPSRAWADWERGWGVVTAVVLAAGFAYSVRRRAHRRTGAAVAPWLDVHLLIGALFPAVLLLHTGFRVPTTGVGRLMWALGLWLALSGVIGRTIQRWIPRLLTSGLRTEAVYERIPELVDALHDKVEALVASADDSLRKLYAREFAASMREPSFRWLFFVDITGGFARHDRAFDHLRRHLPAAQREQLDTLQTLVRTKRDLDAHFTLQRVLRWWVYGHAPIAIALTALATFHIVAILYY